MCIRDSVYTTADFRYLCLSAHYRSDLKFTWESLDAAAAALGRLREFAHEWGEAAAEVNAEAVGAFSEAIFADLNTPRALAAVWELSKRDLPNAVKKAALLHFDRVLGLGLGEWQPDAVEAPAEVAELARRREAARAARDWEEADRLREAIREHGFELEDTPAGAKLRVIRK